MVAEIVCVGTELLLGDIVNTNAQHISKELAHIGIDLYYQTVVGDNKERVWNVLDTALKRSDLIIMTGGLGPTKDDLTKEVAASLDVYKRQILLLWVQRHRQLQTRQRITVSITSFLQILLRKQ